MYIYFLNASDIRNVFTTTCDKPYSNKNYCWREFDKLQNETETCHGNLVFSKLDKILKQRSLTAFRIG